MPARPSAPTNEDPRALRAVSLSGSEVRAGVLVAGVVFVVYLATLYPDVPGGDSGELIGAIATGGVIHPPGYPLYALLGRLLLLIPHGTLAWRVNLLSAICDALAAGVLLVAVARWSRSGWGGFAAAGLFAFGPGIWLYAISAEVFALNNLCAVLLVLIAVLYGEGRDRRYAYAGALVSGLALSNHHTILFVMAPLALWMLWIGRRDLLGLRPLLTLGTLLVAGLVPYSLLFVARRQGALVSWGSTDTWSGLWAHLLRRDYGPLHLAGSEGPERNGGGGSPLGTLGACLEYLARQLGWWGGALALGGLVLSGREDPKRLTIPLSAAALLSVAVFAFLWGLPASDPLHREILGRFWQEPSIVCFAFCGLSVAALGRFAREHALANDPLANDPRRLRAARFAEPAVASAVVLTSFALHVGGMDHHASRIVREYGAEILRAAPPGALLLTKGDLITNATRYLQLAEGMRPDVTVVDQELLGYPWYGRQVHVRYPDVRLPGPRYAPGAPDGFSMKELLDANFDRAPILLCGGVKEGDLTADTAYGRWPLGLCEIVHRGSEPVNVDDWLRESDAALPRIGFGVEARPPGSWEDIAWGDYWEVRRNRGIQLITIAGADPARRRYLAAAATIFQGILDTNPAPRPQLYKDLALAIGRQGLETAGDRARAAAAWRQYIRVAPADDLQLPGIERELARLSGPQ